MHHIHNHAAMMLQDFKKRLLISIALTIPILVLSPMLQMLLHYHFILPGNAYILLLFATLVFIYGGWPFFTGYIAEYKKKTPGMMTLIAIVGAGVIATINNQEFRIVSVNYLKTKHTPYPTKLFFSLTETVVLG